MRILHVAPSFYPAIVYGGPTRPLFDLCFALAELGEHVKVLTTNANGTRETLPLAKFTQRPVQGSGTFGIVYARRLLPQTVSIDLLTELPKAIAWADVVHVTSVYSFPVLPSLLTARYYDKPVVLSPRGTFGRWGQERARWKKYPANRVVRTLTNRRTTFHATAQSEVEDIQNVLGPVPCTIIPNGLRLEEFRLPRNYAAKDKQRPIGFPVLGYLGRLHPKKRLDRLVETLPLLTNRFADVRVELAGPDTFGEAARLRSLAARLGVSDRVHISAQVDGDLRIQFLADLDILVLPSDDENFGNVVVEALAVGTPVIASRRTPWADLERHRCGRWIDATPETIAASIAEMATEDLNAVGERGRAFVFSSFTAQQTAATMMQLYSDVCRASFGT